MENEIVYHTPALLIPCMEGLGIKNDGVYVDLTFGGGGHSREILSRLGKNGRLFAFDQDIDAIANIPDDERLTFCRSNFCFLSNFLDYYGVEKVDGVLADLGVSFHHFDEAERGFSFRFDGPLDMRMNRKSKLTAEILLNEYEEQRLADIFYLYGEMNNARKVASTIVKARQKAPLTTIFQLVELLEPLIGKDSQKKDLAKLFQAIRIEVNDEMGTLKKMLSQLPGVLGDGGRVAILTYHSLEDRLVKNFFKTGNVDGKIEKDFYGNTVRSLAPVNGKVITPDADEIQRNPRSRSAKLRVAEKIGGE
ncbi:MAG: 16S rRNA (cytosine(1402)-N(4))-methyltransferase RsmH [Paludibacteraceae bacterium]|nr:16S rRNA (cytosine(1402)-N(4))-methyltransferase RsmH [Paludibacteraceae bacterium]